MKTADRRPIITVYGSSRPKEHDTLYQEAYELGKLIGKSGMDVATGGYDGTMSAVSRGVHECGGKVIGVTLRLFDPIKPNMWLDQEIRSDSFGERLHHMWSVADGFVVLDGGIGTIAEFAYTWINLQVSNFPESKQPFVLLGNAWEGFVKNLRNSGFIIDERDFELFHIAATPMDTVEYFLSQLK